MAVGTDAPVGVVHGDFYRRNLIWRGGRIVGVVDWDEARVDHFGAELAWSVWEFAKRSSGEAMHPDRAIAFLADYAAAGGPGFPDRMITPLIRERLRWEIRRSRCAALQGERPDEVYEAAEVRAFAHLGRA